MKGIQIIFNRKFLKKVEEISDKEFLKTQTLIKQVVQKKLRENKE